MLKCYTDYPVIGNPNGNVVAVDVLAYDRDKYVDVSYNGNHDSVKLGYVWLDENLTKRLSSSKISCFRLPTEVGLSLQTKPEAVREYKDTYRYTTWYSVCTGNSGEFTFETLKQAVECFIKHKSDSYATLFRHRGPKFLRMTGWGFNNERLITREGNTIDQDKNPKGRYPFKASRIWY